VPAVTTAPPLGAAARADVVVVGAGPGRLQRRLVAGQAGLDVVVLEKAAFPREKVCGDGLTPRGVKALDDMGIDTSPAAGWVRHKGLRVFGGGQVVEVDWPELGRWPDYSLVRPRATSTPCSPGTPGRRRPAAHRGHRHRAAARRRRPGRRRPPQAGPDKEPVEWRAPLVVSAEGLSGRLAKALGLVRREDRPLGVAVRRYVRSPAHARRLPRHLLRPLRRGPDADSMPGYGWIFGMGDGTANVGFGLLDTRARSDGTDYRACCAAGWTAPRRSGSSARSTRSPRCAAPPCRWPSTAAGTTPAACCWPATPAGRSTRSTARASATRWRPAGWPPRPRPGAGPPGGPGARAGRPAPLQPGQARGLRVRHRADAAAARRRPVPGEVLPDRDAVHRLRHRDRLPLPVGRRLRRAGVFGLVEMVLFIVTVFVAYAYVWRRGGWTGTGLGLRTDMGLEEKLPSGVLLTTVEKLVNWLRARRRCGRPRSAWPAAPSR
jgi:hypothetical protein